MKNGAVYIRVSTDEQIEYSPDAQLKKIKEYAKKNNILIISDYIYIENGVSGRSVAKREEFKKMISIAKTKPKPFDVVLVHAYDRFARNVKESRIYKELLRNDLGIELISVTEDFGNDKNSFLMEGIKDILNEYYSLNLRDEVLKGMNEKVSRGEINGSSRFGYDVINGKLEINEEEAKVVKLMYDMYSNSNNNFRDISIYFNSLGIKTKRGKKWETATIKYILQNPVYIGKLRWSGEKKLDYKSFKGNEITNIIDGIHKPIIDIQTWKKAQDKINVNRKFSKPHQPATKNAWHWLKGLIKCSECNHTYIKNDKGKSLRCNGYNKAMCKNGIKVFTKDIENIILNQIKKDFQSEINIKYKEISDDQNIEQDLLEKKLKQIENKKERIKEAYVNGIDTIEEYKANKLMLDKEYKAIKDAIVPKANYEDKIKKSIKLRAKSVYNLLTDDKIDMETKKILAHQLINVIEINTAAQEITIIYNSSPI